MEAIRDGQPHDPWQNPTAAGSGPIVDPASLVEADTSLPPGTGTRGPGRPSGGPGRPTGLRRRAGAVVAAAALTIALGGTVVLGGLWPGLPGTETPASTSATADITAAAAPTPTLMVPSSTPEVVAPAAPVVLDPGTASGDADAVQAINVDATTVAERVVPSVVYVEVSRTGRGGQSAAVASGSGVILDTDGHIVTNNHVVASGSTYRVVLSDGRTYDAALVGSDEVTDLALLDISATDLDPIQLGSSDALSVGDPAVAVGSPLGLQGGPSLTVGVISAFGREVHTSNSSLYGMLQTDAAITEGSSGGALVDGNGNLVGITTAVGVSSVGVEGIGFATPVEIVARVVDELARTGRATQPGLGITGETAYRALADGGQAPVGVRLVSVGAGSAAAVAGLRAGDVIARIASTPIDTMEELVATLRRHSAGDTVSLTVDGTGSERVVDVTLQEL